MMGQTVAHAVVRRLADWGVCRIFGYSGDGINTLFGALREHTGGVEFIQARHEEAAAFMATAHHKYTGQLAGCVSTQGPGAVHLLNGLYDAKLDHTPVVAIVGQQSSSVLGSAYQQEIDLKILFQGVAGDFCQEIRVPAQVPMLVDRAVRHALATRGPAVLIFPHDVQQQPMPDSLPHSHGNIATSAQYRPPHIVPTAEELDVAANLLASGARPAILIGQGAGHASAEVVEIAERLGAGIAYALQGKPVVDNRLPFVTGPTGHLGSTASYELMHGCDTLLMVGTNEPWTEFLPAPGQARAVQVDIDGRNLGSRYPTEVNLQGDAASTLRALLPMLSTRSDRSWRQEVEAQVGRWREMLAQRAADPAARLNPLVVFDGLNARLPDRAVLSVDVGSATYWYARQLDLRPGMLGNLSSTLASMGCAIPYATAAKLAHPDRPVIALTGDGAMQMLGMNELVTVARYRDVFTDPRFVVLVLHNNDLNEVTWEQREMEGDPRFDASQEIPDVDYAAFAKLLGFRGVRVESADQVAGAWDEALSADGPVLIDAYTDPDVPLLAPHMESTHVEHLYNGLANEGDPARRARELVESQLRQQASDR
jgi:pyruvate dehydrogenase (quinone)